MNENDLLNQVEKLSPKKKKGGGRKAKNLGKAGERCISKHLSSITNLSWQRIPNSGAFTGGKNVRRVIELSKGQVLLALGDIIPPDDLKNRFIIESKNYKTFPYKKLLEKKEAPKKLITWIDELQYDTCSHLMTIDKRDPFPILYIKIRENKINGNKKDEWVVINNNLIKKFNLQLPDNYTKFEHKAFDELKKEIEYIDEWIFLDMVEFFKLNMKIFELIS